MRSYWIRMGHKSLQETEKDTQRRTQEGKVKKAEAEITGMSQQPKKLARTARSHRKPGERQGTDSPSEPSEGTSPANTLIFNFWPPDL